MPDLSLSPLIRAGVILTFNDSRLSLGLDDAARPRGSTSTERGRAFRASLTSPVCQSPLTLRVSGGRPGAIGGGLPLRTTGAP